MNKSTLLALAGLVSLLVTAPSQAAETPAAQQQAAEQSKPATATGQEKAPAKELPEEAHSEHEVRGDEHLYHNRFDQAVKEFDKAIAADPQAGILYVKKGIALYRGGKPQEAVPLMDKAIELNKGDKIENWLPLYHKAMALGVSGVREGAMKYFNESIKLKPGSDNYSGRAVAFAQMGKPEQALSDVYSALYHRPNHVPLTDFADQLETLIKTRKEAAKFLKKMAAEEGAQVSDSGLIYFELKQGDGKSPAATDTVKVHYHGTLPNGKVFDSSVNRGEPASFPLNRVIACWTEGLQKMRVGGKAKLVCPADLAYGDRGAGILINPGAALAFEVELLGIE
jgi:FKBP-type peptidyl-prolyl cis-trans isomerase/Flp pilus assembly protein TadD